MSLLALDIGSSSIKGALVEVTESATAAGRIVVGPTCAEPFPAMVAGLPPGHFEVAPQPIVAACRRVVERVLAQSPSDCSPITALVSCGQMGGVILVDRQGAARSNYLSWRDQRAMQPLTNQPPSKEPPSKEPLSYFDEFRGRLTAEDWIALGREVQPGSPLTLLAWLARHDQLDRSGQVGPMSLGDYVWRQLAGGSHLLARTQANGLLNLHTGQLHGDLFERFGIADLYWPQLADEWQVSGRWKQLSGPLSQEIPCYPCVGDHPCALIGTRLEPTELSINVSTGSQVSRLSTSFEPGPYQTRPYFAGQLLNTITHVPAGRSLNVLIDFMTEWSRSLGGSVTSDPWDYVIEQAARVRAGGAVAGPRVDLAFFAGPLGDRGSISEITTENLTVGHLFASAFDAMAENYRQLVSRLCPQRDWSRIVLSGGLVQRIEQLRAVIIRRLSEQPNSSAGPDAARVDAEYRLALHTEETLTGLGQLYGGVAEVAR